MLRRERKRERWRNPLNSFEILTKCVVYSISFGEKDYYTERFSPFWISTCVGYRSRTRRGGRTQTLPSPSVMFFSVCAAFPVAIFRKMSWKKNKNKKNKSVCCKNSAVICFLYVACIQTCVPSLMQALDILEHSLVRCCDRGEDAKTQLES